MFTHPCRGVEDENDEELVRIENDEAGVRKLSQVVKEVAGRCTVKL